MKYLGQVWRLIQINLVFLRHGLDEFIFTLHVFQPLKFLYKIAPWNWFRKHTDSRAVRLRRTLEDLGPIFIKFGQMLSTRRDLLSPEYAKELARLQDQVPPFDNEVSVGIIEKALGRSIDEVFDEFDRQPLASASIAQVHTAKLKDGSEVVVKVVRPQIEKVIHRDLDLMFILARLVERYWSEGKRLRPVEVVEEYEKTILDELDMMREAANGSQLRRNFEDSDLLYVPRIYWDYTSANVLVMERVHGVPVGEMEVLKEHGVDFKYLAETGVEIFFSQVFTHNFFHADMHPGNIFVDTSNPDKAQYIAIDFGIIGALTPSDQRYLAENFYAFFQRDYRRVAELHVESGWVPSDTRVTDFESALRTVCEPIFERPLKEISFGHFLVRLFQVARRFNMEVQPQLVLLQKTLLNIEGLGRDLYPDLDLWQTAKPFIEKWMHEQMGVNSLLKGIKTNFPRLLEKFPEAPLMIHDIIQKTAQDKLELRYQSAQLDRLEISLRHGRQQTGLQILAAASLLSAVWLRDLEGEQWLGFTPASWGLAALALLLALRSFKGLPEPKSR